MAPSLTFVQSVLRLHSLELDHGRLDVAVAHPGLERAEIDAMAQMLGGKGISELVQEKVLAVRPLDALVSMARNALADVEFGALRHSLR